MAKVGLSLTARQEGQPFEQLDVLFVLQKGAMQTWQIGPGVAPQIFRRQVLGQQKLQPVQNLGR